MSLTPRTDSALHGEFPYLVDADFARQLERELNKLEQAPLCANHAEVFYCQRPSMGDKCLLCERDELRRQNERMVELLKQTRHYSIGPLVPSTWFIERDKTLGSNPFINLESENKPASGKGE